MRMHGCLPAWAACIHGCPASMGGVHACRMHPRSQRRQQRAPPRTKQLLPCLVHTARDFKLAPFPAAPQDAAKLSLSYVTLSVAVAATNATRFLTLSETHYLPVAAPGGGRELKTGAAVTAGDAVWVHDESSGSLLEGVIVAKAPVARVGAFVPMTLSGSIIVDGVAASSYSDWAAARLVPGPLRPLLPAAYSAMLALHRAGYRALDAEAWAALAAQVDLTAAGARRYATAALLAAASK